MKRAFGTIAIVLHTIMIYAQGILPGATLSRNGGQVQLSMDISLPTEMPKGAMTVITPRLVGVGDSTDFPAIVVAGCHIYYNKVRGDSLTGVGGDAYIVRGGTDTLRYVRTIAHQPWMDNATLRLEIAEGAPCHTTATIMPTGLRFTPPPPDTTYVVEQKPRRNQLTGTVRGEARVTFPVNRTEILPGLGGNRAELAKIRDAVDQVRNNPEVRITRYTLRGYASPEGSYANNERLARQRTESLRRYMTDQWGVPEAQMATSHVAEDWEGMRRYIESHRQELPDAERLLDIVDRDGDPDTKLALMATRHPKAYKALLDNCFPTLRRTDYTIEYEWLREVSKEETERRMVITPGQWADDPLQQDTYAAPRTYRPWLALKTNLLFDLATAVNAEVEVPIGRRWSAMAEYWTPWYVWHHNSRAFEFQTVGLELRYWTAGRCPAARPLLTGTFWGLYYANGQYDLEWSSSGDQGEFNSVGATFGHSWPLSAHWNLEASISAGAFWGPRRHYNGEYNDTHLIWKYTGRTFYAGPTKLKLSIVWLLGPTAKKKGGEGL